LRDYSFLTTWLIEAPREPIFAALWDSERWPEWWPGVVRAEQAAAGDPATGLGRRGTYEWRSTIPYPVRFEVVATRIERPALLEGRASGGMEGIGRWRLLELGGGDTAATAVLYEWRVRPTAGWMGMLAPLASPVFHWNHDRLMRAGGEGLARHLGARLLARS
jgi:uncharacterized protein YndB with AHSA1/START domain